MADSLLQKWFPQAAKPLIISAPMFTVANGTLAAEVTKAGGLGMSFLTPIQGGPRRKKKKKKQQPTDFDILTFATGMVAAGLDPSGSSPHLAALDEQLTLARRLLGQESDPETPLQVGIGFITLLATTELYRANAVPIVARHRPAFVWLFGSDPAGPLYAELVALFRAAGEAWGLKVFVQVGTVGAARLAARAGADAVVAQGSDAGGHGWAKAASVMTLLPEVVDALRDDEFRGREVAVVAAGGVVDGRGVAAALALGADAVTMGTRVSDSPPRGSRYMGLG